MDVPMDYARRQRDPKRHLVGLLFVLLLHAILIYGLVTGLARKAVEVIKKPVTATVIEELKKPPPPPPPPPPKKVEPPPRTPPPIQQPYVPPPDIPMPAVTNAPTITAVTPTVPVEPYVIQPPAPPKIVEAPPAPPKPAVRRGVTPIHKEELVYPRAAIRANIDKGKVVARLDIDEQGNVTKVTIVSATPARYFDEAVTDGLKNWKFAPEGEKYVAEVEVSFALK